MSHAYSDHIEQLLAAQRAARQAPEVTEEQKRKIAMLKPIYEFAIQMKAAGIIKDVADPDFSHPTCLSRLTKQTREYTCLFSTAR